MLTIENKSKDEIYIELPETIGRLKNLYTLSVTNIVKSIPEEIGECKELSFLNITNCRELKTLPVTLLNCPCLTFISKRNSGLDIKNVPEELAQYLIVGDELWSPNFPDYITDQCVSEGPTDF
jgi:Leucine-rich repeat (LRR) protein